MVKKILFISLVFFASLHCGPSKETLNLQKQSGNTFGVLPDKMPGSENDTPERIALGERLFFEKDLSFNGSQSCNTCHNITNKLGGVDNQPTSRGALGGLGNRNSPTVLNAGFHIAQFWDGRSPDLHDQAQGPILSTGEMAMPSIKSVMARLKNNGEYVELFNKAFPKDGMTFDNLAEAIAAFERTLITHDRFEDFVNGDSNALTGEERRGLQTFISVGCTICHNGPTFGGKSYMKVGTLNPYPTDDLGRYNVTRQESDKYVFKVPSLKNVALTAPYFHDGKVATLEEAVEKMAYLQLGRKLSSDEISSITAFLKTLTDKNR